MAVPAMTQVRFPLPTGGTPVPRAIRKFDRFVNFARTKNLVALARRLTRGYHSMVRRRHDERGAEVE